MIVSLLPPPGRRARSWLAVYAVCVAFVFSFIFFETLDVDGSDFPVSTTKMVVKLAESQHSNDLRRAWLATPIPHLLKAAAERLDRSGDATRLERVSARETERPVLVRRDRDAPPSA